MNRLALAVVCWFAIAGYALADLTIKGELRVDRDKLVRLTVDGALDKAALIWDFDEDKLDAEETGKRLVFCGPPGTYKIKCRAITLGVDGKTTVETARAVVVIGGGGPPPPPPPPPDPESPLLTALKNAYASETAIDKSTSVRGLAAVYNEAVQLVRDDKVNTMGALWKVMEAGAQAAKVNGKVLRMQSIIAGHVKANVPSTSSARIDTANRDSIVKALGEVADALREVAP